MEILLYTIFTLAISVTFIHFSNKNILGLTFKRFTNFNSFTEAILVLFLVYFITSFIIEIIYNFIIFFINNQDTPELTEVIKHMSSNSNAPNYPSNTSNNTPQYPYSVQDPVRYWPSGSVTVPSAFLTAYRMTPGSHRQKLVAATSTLGVTVPLALYNQAIENPNGFNMLAHSFSEFRRTGQWPNLTQPSATNPTNPTQNTNPYQNTNQNPNLNPNLQNNHVNNNVSPNDNNSNNFWGDNNDSYINYINNHINDIINNYLINPFLTLIKPVEVTGHLDDLIGQQLFILILMLIVVISLFILMFIYFTINILLHNKERILSITNNKFLKFYIKYQLLLGKLSLVVFPCLIFTGLFVLFSGLYFIITHQIPFDELGIDFHTFITRR